MPLPKETDGVVALRAMPKGDLYVKFEITFPQNMTASQRKTIVEILRKNAEETDS